MMDALNRFRTQSRKNHLLSVLRNAHDASRDRAARDYSRQVALALIMAQRKRAYPIR